MKSAEPQSRTLSYSALMLSFLLASCAAPTPPPTVTPLPTSTPPPTFTTTPTRRPPTASEPSWIQNDEGLFVFDSDTNEWDKVESPAGGSGIYESGDKQFIFMDNQLMWLESVSEVDGETQVVTKDGQKLVWAGGEWVNAVVTYTSEQIANMNEAEKLASAPDQAGYTEAVSSVKDNIVKYYDKNGNLDHAYDLLTGQEVSLEQAGIIEWDLTDGTKWEFPYFDAEVYGSDLAAVQAGVDLMSMDGAHETTKEQLRHNEKIKNYYNEHGKKLPGLGDVYQGGSAVGYRSDLNQVAFGVWVSSLDDGTVIGYYGDDDEFHSIYVDVDPLVIERMIEDGIVASPLEP